MAKFKKGNKGYIIQLGSFSLFNPLDATTYYFGLQNIPILIEGLTRILIPKNCIIKRCYVTFTQVSGSTETSTINIRVNDTTDTVISNSVNNNSTHTTFNNTNLSIQLNAGDYIEIKWVTPTWITNPTSLTISVIIYAE